jgi:hypothetical protein
MHWMTSSTLRVRLTIHSRTMDAASTCVVFICILLALSGFASIAISLRQLYLRQQAKGDHSHLEVPSFKLSAPAGFVYGIGVILGNRLLRADLTGILLGD